MTAWTIYDLIYSIRKEQDVQPKPKPNPAAVTIKFNWLIIVFMVIAFFLPLFFDRPIVYLDTCSDLELGNVARTPISSLAGYVPGTGISNINHGFHAITGGTLHMGSIGNGLVTKILGIYPNDPTGQAALGFGANNQPFARNFAYMLFELKQEGVKTLSLNMLGRTNVDYLNMYRGQVSGLPPASFSEFSISKKMINDLGGAQ